MTEQELPELYTANVNQRGGNTCLNFRGKISFLLILKAYKYINDLKLIFIQVLSFYHTNGLLISQNFAVVVSYCFFRKQKLHVCMDMCTVLGIVKKWGMWTKTFSPNPKSLCTTRYWKNTFRKRRTFHLLAKIDLYFWESFVIIKS